MLQTTTVNVVDAIDDALAEVLGGFKQYCSRGVAKERASGAILIVGHACHLLGTHHNHLLVKSSLDVSTSGIRAHDKSGACCLNVVAVAFLFHATVVHYYRRR